LKLLKAFEPCQRHCEVYPYSLARAHLTAFTIIMPRSEDRTAAKRRRVIQASSSQSEEEICRATARDKSTHRRVVQAASSESEDEASRPTVGDKSAGRASRRRGEPAAELRQRRGDAQSMGCDEDEDFVPRSQTAQKKGDNYDNSLIVLDSVRVCKQRMRLERLHSMREKSRRSVEEKSVTPC
jgi:hypothetical protein